MLFYNIMAGEARKNWRAGKPGAALGVIFCWLISIPLVALGIGTGLFLLGAPLWGAFRYSPWAGIAAIATLIAMSYGIKLLTIVYFDIMRELIFRQENAPKLFSQGRRDRLL